MSFKHRNTLMMVVVAVAVTVESAAVAVVVLAMDGEGPHQSEKAPFSRIKLAAKINDGRTDELSRGSQSSDLSR